MQDDELKPNVSSMNPVAVCDDSLSGNETENYGDDEETDDYDLVFENEEESAAATLENDAAMQLERSNLDRSPSQGGRSPLSPSGQTGLGCVLTNNDILERISEQVNSACEMLELPPEVSECLLRCCEWDSNALALKYFESKEEVFKKAGFPPDVEFFQSDEATASSSMTHEVPQNENSSSLLALVSFVCPILVIDVPIEETSCLPCGHRFSNDCWENYLRTAVMELEVCLGKKCPSLNCPELVSHDFWRRFLSEELYITKFQWSRVRSYVNNCVKISWCPAPDCPFVVEQQGQNKDVKCSCGQKFCGSCNNEPGSFVFEPHTPIPCDVVKAWHLKNTNEAENVTWILVHTKMCPGCKQPIEKNQGCMHMTCRCGFQFCWTCLTEWTKHQHQSSYRCNVFEGGDDSESKEKNFAEAALERYAHYFERYRTHNAAQRLAEGDQMVRTVKQMEDLHAAVGDIVEVDFLKEAVLQIVECRHFVKWTYAYGYFAKWKTNTAKLLFEHQQGQLEKNLEGLHEIIETFCPNEHVESNERLFDIRRKLVNKTAVVKKYFKDMSDQFEKDFGQYNDFVFSKTPGT